LGIHVDKLIFVDKLLFQLLHKNSCTIQKLILACDRAGLTVVLDFEYDHVDEQNKVLSINPDYFFKNNDCRNLQNLNSCGNDLCIESPMIRRLIIDSLTYFIKTYSLDEFRFDFVELFGREFLYQLEWKLRLVNDNVQIIYKPWSSRENIA